MTPPTVADSPNSVTLASAPGRPLAGSSSPYRLAERSDCSVIRRAVSPAPSLATWRELAAMVGFAVLYQVAFGFIGFGGYGAAMFFTGAGVMVIVARRRVRAPRVAVAMAVVLVATSCRLAYAPSAGASLLAMLALMGLALSMWQRRVHVTMIVRSAVAALGYSFHQISGFGRRIKRTVRTDGLGPLIARASISGGVGLVFFTIFAFANPIVERLARALFVELSRGWSVDLLGRAATTMFAMLAGIACMRPLLAKKVTEALDLHAPSVAPALQRTAITTLYVVNALFFAYNALDAVVLLGGRPPEGITTQAYAHQGAAWLTVALVLASATLSLMFRVGLKRDECSDASRRLAYGWIAQSFVLALFASERVRIHIKYSGLSDLRFVAMFGVATATAGLLLVGYKIHANRTFMWLVRRQVDVLAVAALLYTVIPTNRIAARANVSRILAGDLGPLVHVEEQIAHSESAALLLPLLKHPDSRVREGVAFAELQKFNRLRGTRHARWSEENLADTRAYESLDSVAVQIESLSRGANARVGFTALKNESAWAAANARH